MWKMFARDPYTDWLVAGMLAVMTVLFVGLVTQ